MRATFKYKLYQSKRNRHLVHLIELASEIWNHALALRKRYFQRFKKFLGSTRLQSYISHLIKRTKFRHWKALNSQARQDVIQRMDKGYARFFQELKKAQAQKKPCLYQPPSFQSRHHYKSFTLKQTGYLYIQKQNSILIGGQKYKFHLSREIEGTIKTITVKRNKLGELFLCFSCLLDNVQPQNAVTTGRKAGFDFGLKTFLVASDGSEYIGLQAFKKLLRQVKKANQNLSRKKKGSKNRKKAKLHLARTHQNVVHLRQEFQWKLARKLVETYDTLYFETLDFQEMKARWGRKLSDLAPASFLEILKYLCLKTGKTFQQIDRWFPSTKRCHLCFYKNDALTLGDRIWTCPECLTTHQRDFNAAKNVELEGVGTSAPSIDVVRQKLKASAYIDDARIPRL